MLLTNDRLDKLQAARVYYQSQDMLTNIFRGPLVEEMVTGAASENDAQGSSTQIEEENDNDDNDDVVDGPRVTGSVKLAVTPRKTRSFFVSYR